MSSNTINYSAIDFDALKSELINYLKETNSFRDANFVNSNIGTLVELHAYIGSLFGYYINSIANEPFLPSAKQYKNLNRICKILSYNPRGTQASSVDVVGSLLPEYCFGKEDQYFEIPAYSNFLSNKPTTKGVNFSFTNEDQVIYVVKGYGTTVVDQNNFAYDNQTLPLTKPASYWTVGSTGSTGTTGTSGISFDVTKLSLLLSDTNPLTILNRLDPTNYKGFDPTIPLYNGSDSQSYGQPFNRNISAIDTNLNIIPNTLYYVVFNFDSQNTVPYLTLMQDGPKVKEKMDNVIMTVMLVSDDQNGTTYTLKEISNNSKGRFYVGVMGAKNLESITFSYDKLENTTNGVKQIFMDINKSGNNAPLELLVDGVVYPFVQGRLKSQIFTINSWDTTQEYYNINISLNNLNSPITNYDASINVTSKDAGINEVTIAKIYPGYVDQTTGIKALDKDPGQRFGNIQAIPKTDITTTEQRAGFVTVADGVTKIFVPFETPFTKNNPSDVIDYIIELTPDNNVQLWYSDKSEIGFTINIERDAGFIGTVNWLATRYNTSKIKQTSIYFDSPIPTTVNNQNNDYIIFLSASDNVRVWYTNKTANGFTINTEKSFDGTITYSTFASITNDAVKTELNSSTQKKGSIVLSPNTYTKDITFDTAFDDITYGLHMVANQNYNVWYTNKTTNGFTINVEQGFQNDITVDWFADQSSIYQYQKHGVVSFSGQISNGQLPGLRFVNIPETFLISNLIQGSIKFSYINSNGSINSSNNNLNLAYTADRMEDEVKFEIKSNTISYTNIRVFVKNDSGDWEEWSDSTSQIKTIDSSVGQKVFFVRINEYQNPEISFGDGINYGVNPFGKEIIIFGLDSVGKDGNIPPNTLSSSILLSQSILGDDDVNIQFEQQFIQLIGLKTDAVFASGENFSTTSLYDSEGTHITETELKVLQFNPAFGGNFTETTEELRSNASSANLRQDRIVSLEDYRTFCNQYFSDYIIKTQVFTYKDLINSNFNKLVNMSNYFFNYIFILALPTHGNSILKIHRDYILNTLNTKFKSMATVEHELIQGVMVPIDVMIRFKPTKFGSPTTIQAQINNLITNYFDRNNHDFGETLEIGPIEKIVLNIPEVENAEISLNKNTNNLSPSDYVVNATTTATQSITDIKRQKVLEILAKDPDLIKLVDPLFSVTDNTGKQNWVLSQNINLNTYEFPILGNIITQVEV